MKVNSIIAIADMKIIFYLSLLLLQEISAAPHLKLTRAEYDAMKSLLNGNRAVSIQPARAISKTENEPNTHFVLFPIGGNQHVKKQINKWIPLRPEFKRIGIKGNFKKSREGERNTIRRSGELLPLYRNQVDKLNPLSKRRFNPKPRPNVPRFKRQTEDEDDYDYDYDYDEEEQSFAEQLSFGLSSGGGILGGAVGGFLDTSGTALLKLINSLESLGLIAVTQLDDFLDAQEKKNEESTTETPYGSDSGSDISLTSSSISSDEFAF